ncbi:2-keto-3-deoxy-galactonokinase (plasmid) [Sulfitobacter sp. SK012]|uniref:2-dehydro-3-deoxygalactonokinase n=1 Tax=Sulfitobacter sp. SK012 TaxID=1389005 RepID=UPI000E0A7E0C|nr:2-dehydro-3-deoxygalactonokinase [Sulfitobacter sp. SK012]AXI49325.1 2-keto-3-deoxy-galactonokinase [Sulfitobacter sp. SK012]
MSQTSFVAVDWGTSSFRLWVMDASGEVLNSTQGPFGMSRLKPTDFSRVLEENLNKLGVDADVPVVICGMAGAAQGWCEAPYLTAPTRLDALGKCAVAVANTMRHVRILPGIKQLSPANVMRGEETQISGLLHHHPDFSGTVCLPGTHTKWVRVADKSILDFETCMTGEQFAFFSETSVLSHSMTVEGWSDTAFANAVAVALDDPTSVPRLLFAIRAEMLIGEQSAAEARARLSGLLIGQELVATRPYWDQENVTLIGAPKLCDLYLQAFEQIGIAGRAMDSEAMTVAGLLFAYQIQQETHHV